MIKFLHYLFYFIFGLFFSLYVIYIRFFIVRLPKDLLFFKDTSSNYRVFLLLVSIMLCLYLIIKNYKNMFNIQATPSFFSLIIFKVLDTLDQALNVFYNVIMSIIPDAYSKVSYVAYNFYYYASKRTEFLLLFIQYCIRFIIVFVFLIDVFIYFKLDYFYKIIFLFCFSLLCNILIYILKDFVQNLEEIEDALIITDKGIDTNTLLPITNYRLKEEYEHFDLTYHVEQFILINKLKGYLEIYDKYYKFYNPRINIIIYSLYLVGWLYVLYINVVIYL